MSQKAHTSLHSTELQLILRCVVEQRTKVVNIIVSHDMIQNFVIIAQQSLKPSYDLPNLPNLAEKIYSEKLE